MTAVKPGLRRCAVYTRKSSDEGLEQDFNSLDAQHEACDAYIRSQAGEGWKPVRSRYDDGGFSGGTMDRPGLQRLLADIRAAKVDTVVVYKVDRLTRSLTDFGKMVEVFDAHGVSFVSVTQAFNTTTSMGRLTLNMLLSFAQFEREVTGERIRDKIAASKKKGMWMGGFVPLGYEPDGRTLTVNEDEAGTIRTIFRLYLEHGTVRRVKEEADRLGLATKIRTSITGRTHGGRPLSRGHLYKLLGNPLYAGRIAHKGKTYDGLHPPIVDAGTWDAVQAGLAGNAPAQSSRSRTNEPSLLAGKLFDESGARLTPSHAVKSGRRYRYYVSSQLIGRSTKDATDRRPDGWRLPAREIERIVGDAVTGLLADPALLASAARDAGMPADRISGLLKAVIGLRGDPIGLVERVDLGTGEIVIRLSLAPLTGETATTILHTVPVRLRRRGVEMRLVLEGAGNGNARPDPALVKAVVRAHKWFDDLVSGRATSLKAIARAEGCGDRYVGQLMPLAFLGPDIVEAILAGTQPVELTAETLTKRIDLPLSWAEQKALLGFD